jgi:energy-coupling factor transporter ATP-binding protein EcfA2
MAMPREKELYRIFPEEITIENFKSLKQLTLKLKPGVNLLVGPNASGKTNILEAIYFLSKAISSTELLKIPYAPHIPHYWSPEDLFYMRQVENPISYRILFRVSKRKEDKCLKHNVSFTIKFSLSSNRESIEPSYVSIDWGTAKIEIYDDLMNVYINVKYFPSYEEVLKKIIKDRNTFTPFHRVLTELYRKLSELKESITLPPTEECILLTQNKLQLEFGEISIVKFFLQPFFIGFTEFENIVSSAPNHEEKNFGLLEIPGIRVTPSPSFRFPHHPIVPLLIHWHEARLEDFSGFPMTKTIVDLDTIRNLLEKCILLKHPGIGEISEPQAFTEEMRLHVRARNLPQVFYKLSAEGRTRYIERILREVLGNGVGVEPRSFAGRVFFVISERGVELPPPNIADGIIKLMAIAAAVELQPAILLIDELENSLHAEALEKVFDVLDSLEIPVLAATHSPVLVDLAKPEKVIAVSRTMERGTTVEYFKEPGRLREKLVELGIALSDYVFYEKTRSQQTERGSFA